MTTKTIPEYLEDESAKRGDEQLRIKEEAARIQLLHRDHHRTAKQPGPDMLPATEAAAKPSKTVAAMRKKPLTGRKTATKARYVA